MSITDCIKDFVAENNQYELCENYSGYGTFGGTCLGIIIQEGNSFMDLLAELTAYIYQHDVEDENLDLAGLRYAPEGNKTVVYFPQIET